MHIYDFQNKYLVRYFCILNVLFHHPAEPSKEAGGDENRRRQKTNHATVHRSAGHRVEQHTVYITDTLIYDTPESHVIVFSFLYRDFSPALFNSVPILPSGSSMSCQLAPQLSSDSSPGQASSLSLRPNHDPMLMSPPASGTSKGLEDNKDGYAEQLRSGFYLNEPWSSCFITPSLISGF